MQADTSASSLERNDSAFASVDIPDFVNGDEDKRTPTPEPTISKRQPTNRYQKVGVLGSTSVQLDQCPLTLSLRGTFWKRFTSEIAGEKNQLV